MDTENDPEFWEWLIQQQKQQNVQKEAFQPLVLELPRHPIPLQPPQEEVEQPKNHKDSSEHQIDIFGDDFVIFKL